MDPVTSTQLCLLSVKTLQDSALFGWHCVHKDHPQVLSLSLSLFLKEQAAP